MRGQPFEGRRDIASLILVGDDSRSALFRQTKIDARNDAVVANEEIQQTRIIFDLRFIAPDPFTAVDIHHHPFPSLVLGEKQIEAGEVRCLPTRRVDRPVKKIAFRNPRHPSLFLGSGDGDCGVLHGSKSAWRERD